MKILPLVKDFRDDIASSGIRIKNASVDGYNIANRTAKIYHQGSAKRYYNTTKCISCKVIKGTTRQELPYLAGAIGMLVPLPLMSPLFMGLGFIARFLVTGSDSIHQGISKAHNIKIKV